MYKERYCGEELLNVTEEVVFEVLHEIVISKTIDFCQCEICLLDIAAITLNNMPPVYWGNRFEKYRPRSEQQKGVEADMRKLAREELLKAIKVVIANPHH